MLGKFLRDTRTESRQPVPSRPTWCEGNAPSCTLVTPLISYLEEEGEGAGTAGVSMNLLLPWFRAKCW